MRLGNWFVAHHGSVAWRFNFEADGGGMVAEIFYCHEHVMPCTDGEICRPRCTESHGLCSIEVVSNYNRAVLICYNGHLPRSRP